MAVRARTGCVHWLADEEARDREIHIRGHAEAFLPHMAPAAAVLGHPLPLVRAAAHSLYVPGGLSPPGFLPGMPSFVPGEPMPQVLHPGEHVCCIVSRPSRVYDVGQLNMNIIALSVASAGNDLPGAKKVRWLGIIDWPCLASS
jgi:hypothetical protein